MFSKILSAFLVIVLLAGSMSAFSAGAVETEKSTDLSQVKTIKLEVKNNIATYTDDNGKEVDVSSDIPKRKARTALPSSYDLREHGRSTGVKNQGAYGLCWSFASTASMESSILTKALSNETSDTLDLSEAGNSWYLRTNTEDISSPLYNDYLDDPSKGAQGGYSGYVADSISSGYGAYYIDRNNGPMCPEITFRDCKFTGVVYDIDLQTREITINGYAGVDSNIVIPDVMYGHPVVAFEDYFKLWGPSESDITSISLPGSIKSVPSGLFCWYDNLESVTICEGVEEIGDYLFEECRKLTDINLPNSLRSIGEYAFFNCGAESVVLGENIEFIGDYALGYQLVGEEAVLIEGFTISGYAGTVAERYAQANGFKFIDLSA